MHFFTVAHYAITDVGGSYDVEDVGYAQEAQLSPRDRATRRISCNRAKCRTDVRQMTFRVIQGHWKWHESTCHMIYL